METLRKISKIWKKKHQKKSSHIIACALSTVFIFCFFRTAGWMESPESTLANELLIAFDDADAVRLKQTTNDQTFTLLDNTVLQNCYLRCTCAFRL